VWFDLYAPTDDERRGIERTLSLDLPTREDMLEIEPSSRLHVDHEAVYMTATIIAHADRPNPSSDVVTFIVTSGRLVTLRYEDPKPVRTFSSRVLKQPALCSKAERRPAGPRRRVHRPDRGHSREGQLGPRHALAGDLPRRPAGDGRRSHLDLKAVLRSLGRNEDLASTRARACSA